MDDDTTRTSLLAGQMLFDTVEHGNLDDLRRIFSEDAVVWHNTDEDLVGVETSIRNLRTIRESASRFHYADIKREPTPVGFVQQHTLIVEMPDGRRIRDLACCVCTVNGEGRITRMDAYHDSAATSTMAHKQLPG